MYQAEGTSRQCQREGSKLETENQGVSTRWGVHTSCGGVGNFDFQNNSEVTSTSGVMVVPTQGSSHSGCMQPRRPHLGCINCSGCMHPWKEDCISQSKEAVSVCMLDIHKTAKSRISSDAHHKESTWSARMS
eukprot:1159562-Pelagomonas_calceolata.AAC.6